MKAYMTTKIKSEKDAQRFITELYFDDNMYHLAESAKNIINLKTNEKAFTAEECELLDQRVNEVFEYIEDPFILCLALVK
jgi:protocatechuate 3,4-dioxygenase beta subunit